MALGIFKSGKNSTRETKERQQMRPTMAIKPIQIVYTYIPSIKCQLNYPVIYSITVKPFVETPINDHVTCVDNITPIGLIRIRPKI